MLSKLLKLFLFKCLKYPRVENNFRALKHGMLGKLLNISVQKELWELLRLYVQGDNTVRELKNGLSGVMMAALVNGRFFDECGHHHLPVGHTHEDVGWGQTSQLQ